MSWATCYSGSNNIHFNSPPLMSDGRHLTNWDPTCKGNEILQQQNNINTNYNYRHFLINNGLSIIARNNNKLLDEYDIHNMNDAIQHNKYIVKSYNDNNVNFGYETSDLKNMYMSRELLNSKLSAPIIIMDKK